MALFCSYYLQLKKIQAVHETVVSIFAGGCDVLCVSYAGELSLTPAGMFVGLIIRLSAGDYIQSLLTFNYEIFFNVLLPPIILNSGYELHQVGLYPDAMSSELTLPGIGQLLSQHWVNPDLCVRRHLYLRLRARHYPLSLVVHSSR